MRSWRMWSIRCFFLILTRIGKFTSKSILNWEIETSRLSVNDSLLILIEPASMFSFSINNKVFSRSSKISVSPTQRTVSPANFLRWSPELLLLPNCVEANPQDQIAIATVAEIDWLFEVDAQTCQGALADRQQLRLDNNVPNLSATTPWQRCILAKLSLYADVVELPDSLSGIFHPKTEQQLGEKGGLPCSTRKKKLNPHRKRKNRTRQYCHTINRRKLSPTAHPSLWLSVSILLGLANFPAMSLSELTPVVQAPNARRPAIWFALRGFAGGRIFIRDAPLCRSCRWHIAHFFRSFEKCAWQHSWFDSVQLLQTCNKEVVSNKEVLCFSLKTNDQY